jgi:putative AlgH/UPF0301 family transcriptional regulator
MEPELDLFTILPEDKIPEKGRILISEPFLPDTFFNRSIVLLTDHTAEGSVGFVGSLPAKSPKIRSLGVQFNHRLHFAFFASAFIARLQD